MTDTPTDGITPSMEAAINAAAANNKTPVLSDQKSHPQRLRTAMFNAAKNAEHKYRQEHPEASPALVTDINMIAFKRKPPEYLTYLDNLVDGWLSGQRDCTETNAATVARIRDRFPGHTFSNSLLNKDLSAAALDKAKEVAASKGIYLDTRTYNTLSKIKRAMRQGKLTPSTGERIVIAATITDTHFGPFKIERHGKQETIRFRRPDGSRPRIAVADLRAMAGLLMEAEQDGEHSTLSLYDIEILPQNRCNPQNSVKAPEPEAQPGDIPGILPQTIGEPERPGLKERIAALKLAQNPVYEPKQYPPGYDPLCDEPI